jgi:3-dehydroquinate synthase
MVDAAVGGKTAVDHPRGKNLIGALHQPRAVLCDVGFLGTLPDRELRSGLAEVVKAAVVGDARLFRFLERSPGALLARHPETLVRVITAACRVKVRVVTADPEEEGLRAVLNFGHTLGHAVELLARYRLTHGEAVAIGMALESRAGEAAGIVAKGEAARIASVLRSFSLPTALPAFITPDRLLAAARTDKKTRKGELRFALPRNLGRMTDLDRAFTVRLAENLLRQALAPSTRRQRLAPSWQ